MSERQPRSTRSTVADRAREELRPPRRMPFAVLILALIGGGLCALLALNTATAASEVRERQVDAANAALNDTEQQLSRDVASLQAPAELARRAAALGLVPADAPAFLRVDSNGSITVLGSPAPVSNPAPAPTPSTSPTPTLSSSTTATTSATTSGARTAGAPTSGARTSGASTTATGTTPSKASPTPPSSTPPPPTPTVTLPGGPR